MFRIKGTIVLFQADTTGTLGLIQVQLSDLVELEYLWYQAVQGDHLRHAVVFIVCLFRITPDGDK
jgi:hypothetical protein